MPNPIADARYADFEALGEVQVRQNLALHVYGDENKRLAAAWLSMKEAGRADSHQTEQTSIARRAADAAEESARSSTRAAEAAERQAKYAKWALGISILALIAAIAGWV